MNMKSRRCFFLLIALLPSPLLSLAQPLSEFGIPEDPVRQLDKFLNFDRPFSAAVKTIIRDQTNGESFVMETLSVFSEGNSRCEFDTAKTKGQNEMSPQSLAKWK